MALPSIFASVPWAAAVPLPAALDVSAPGTALAEFSGAADLPPGTLAGALTDGRAHIDVISTLLQQANPTPEVRAATPVALVAYWRPARDAPPAPMAMPFGRCLGCPLTLDGAPWRAGRLEPYVVYRFLYRETLGARSSPMIVLAQAGGSLCLAFQAA